MTDFQALIVQYSYLGIFLWFVFFDQVTPIPEELILISMGFAANQGLLNPFAGVAAALLGLIIIDNVYFGLARSGKYLFKRLKKPKVVRTMQRFQTRIQEHDWQTILLLSFFPKLRFLTPFMAAAAGIPWLRFTVLNALSSAAYVILYVLVGIFFETQLKQVSLENLIFYIMGFVTIIGIFTFIWMFRKK
ncbi:MAG: DedA family protein [Saprospiraceae bacterium]